MPSPITMARRLSTAAQAPAPAFSASRAAAPLIAATAGTAAATAVTASRAAPKLGRVGKWCVSRKSLQPTHH